MVIIRVKLLKLTDPQPLDHGPHTRGNGFRKRLAREGYRIPSAVLVLPFMTHELPFKKPPLVNSPAYREFQEWLWTILTGFSRDEWKIEEIICFPEAEGEQFLDRLDACREERLQPLLDPAECTKLD